MWNVVSFIDLQFSVNSQMFYQINNISIIMFCILVHFSVGQLTMFSTYILIVACGAIAQ